MGDQIAKSELDQIATKYKKLSDEDRIALVETLPDGKNTTLADFLDLLAKLNVQSDSPKKEGKANASASNFASWLKKIEKSTTEAELKKLSEQGQNVWAINEGLKSNSHKGIRWELRENEKICNNSQRLTTYNYFVMGRKLRDTFNWFQGNKSSTLFCWKVLTNVHLALSQKTWADFYKTLDLGVSQSYADKLRSLYLQLSVAPRLMYAETNINELTQYGATFVKHLQDNPDDKKYWGNVPGGIVRQRFDTGGVTPKMEIQVLSDVEKDALLQEMHQKEERPSSSQSLREDAANRKRTEEILKQEEIDPVN